MKVIMSIIIDCLLILFSSISFAQQNTAAPFEDFPTLTGPYLGQNPPGMKAEIFAPNILVNQKQAHSNIVFSPDGTECYWCNNGIWFSKLENNKWNRPIMVPFSKKEFSDDAPFFSHDGKQLFFASKRAVDETDTTRKENLWVVDFEENGWSTRKLLPPNVNDMFQHWQASVDSKGNLYFAHRLTKDSDADIYWCKYNNGEYQKAEKLGNKINSEHNESNPFIGPNDDYMIFTRRNNHPLENGHQDVSLFISFKLPNKSWSQPFNLKEYLNFKNSANCAAVSTDGNYLFFLDIYEGKYQRYWISADFIDDIRKMHLNVK